MVEGNGLENRRAGNGTVGSNPTLSAMNHTVHGTANNFQGENMANIADFAEALAQEAKLAQTYERLESEASNEEFKQKLSELKKASEAKMKSLYELMNSVPWFSE